MHCRGRVEGCQGGPGRGFGCGVGEEEEEEERACVDFCLGGGRMSVVTA